MTRGTIVWFVGSAVVGAAAGGLHLLRSELGGAHTGVPLAVGAFGLTALAAAMLFHGVVLAAREQDAAAGPAPLDDDLAAGDPRASRAARAPGVAGAPERAQRSDSAESADRSDPAQPSGAPEPPAVYTFRAGKQVTDQPRRPAKRDRPSRG
jgi:type IV secretory pathway TrbL component